MLVCGKNVLKETPINKIHKVYLKEGFKDQEILSFLKENKIRYEFTPEFRLNKMVNERHQGVVIDIDDYIYYKLEDVLENSKEHYQRLIERLTFMKPEAKKLCMENYEKLEAI